MIGRLMFAFQRRGGKLLDTQVMGAIGLSRISARSYMESLERRGEVRRDGVYWLLVRKVKP